MQVQAPSPSPLGHWLSAGHQCIRKFFVSQLSHGSWSWSQLFATIVLLYWFMAVPAPSCSNLRRISFSSSWPRSFNFKIYYLHSFPHIPACDVGYIRLGHLNTSFIERYPDDPDNSHSPDPISGGEKSLIQSSNIRSIRKTRPCYNGLSQKFCDNK